MEKLILTDDEIKEKFLLISDILLTDFLELVRNLYGENGKFNTITISNVDLTYQKLGKKDIIGAYNIHILINGKDLSIWRVIFSNIIHLTDGDKTTTYARMNNEYYLNSTEYELNNKMKILVKDEQAKKYYFRFEFPNSNIYDVKISCDNDWLLNDPVKIVDYFRNNACDDISIYELIKIISQFINLKECSIDVKDKLGNYVFYKNGVLVLEQETIQEGNQITTIRRELKENNYIETKTIINNTEEIKKLIKRK